MAEYISKTKFEELMRKKARNNFDLYYADKSKRYHANAIGYTIAADEAHVFPASDVQPLSVVAEHIKNRLYETAFNTDDEKASRAIEDMAKRIDFWIDELKDGDPE